MTSTIVCTCPKFISPILKREMESLGYTVQAAYQTGVEIEGTFEDVLRLNLLLRTAHRVLWLVQRFKAQTPDDLFYNARSIEWEQFIDENGYVCIVSSVDTPSITNTQFANQKLKDAIVDRLRSVTGKRPNSGPGTDKTVVFLYWKGSECVVYLDTSGTPISKRGYRQQPHKAPLNELLAAAIVLSTKWDKDTAFVNPMCGSGTLAIEAAMIARNIPSQYRRTNFGFMHIKLFDAAVWEELRRKEKRNEKQELSFPIIASDRDSQAVAATRTNARSAGVLHDLDVRICDFAKTPIPEGE
ncbi:MAG: class I SAM-dependent RNA methyltransferase, partial [Candidatus Kapabacteria bacterium]|nr:class I SAM-dependent RNA methyltransferase [Candidatus Kapabacteria bacterium]